MTTGPTDYPSSWTPRGAPQQAPPPAQAAPIEPIMLAIDSYLSALTPDQFDELVRRTRS